MDEDIVIPNWDISTITPNKIDNMGELLKKIDKKQRLREEKKKENQVFEDIKIIFFDAPSIKVDSTQPILDQLVEIVHKFNEYLNGQEKLIQRVETKFENRVLEQVAQKIAINQVELSIILVSQETSVNNII